jgi:group I intron endonuclease
MAEQIQRRVIAYSITCLVNGKAYIGMTRRRLADRWQDHKELAPIATKGRLYAAMRKYGIENFVITHIATVLNPQDASEVERLLIAQCDSFRLGYNATDGGERGYRFDYPEQAREKMRHAMTGRKQSPEMIAKRIATGRLRHGSLTAHLQTPEMRRKHSEWMRQHFDHGPEWAAKVSVKLKGRMFTEEWRKKISEAKKGQPVSDATRAAQRRGGWKLPPRSPEHQAKLNESRRKNHVPKPKSIRGKVSPRVPITTVQQINALRGKMSTRQIARLTGVSKSAVWCILHRVPSEQ